VAQKINTTYSNILPFHFLRLDLSKINWKKFLIDIAEPIFLKSFIAQNDEENNQNAEHIENIGFG